MAHRVRVRVTRLELAHVTIERSGDLPLSAPGAHQQRDGAGARDGGRLPGQPLVRGEPPSGRVGFFHVSLLSYLLIALDRAWSQSSMLSINQTSRLRWTFPLKYSRASALARTGSTIPSSLSILDPPSAPHARGA